MEENEELMDDEDSTEDSEEPERKSKAVGSTPNKVYVGNLPFSVNQEELKKLFSSYGEISEATVISDKFSGRSKGFGFVTFAKKKDADKAVSEMNDKDMQGRPLKVSEAKPMDPDRPRPPRRSFGGGDRDRGFGGGDRGRSGGRDSRPRRF